MFSHKAAKIDFLTNDFYGTLNIQIFAYPEILIPGYPPSDKDFTHTFGDFTHTFGDFTHSFGDFTHTFYITKQLNFHFTHSFGDFTHSFGDFTHTLEAFTYTLE